MQTAKHDEMKWQATAVARCGAATGQQCATEGIRYVCYFSDNVRTVRVRYFAVRWPYYATKINYHSVQVTYNQSSQNSALDVSMIHG